MTLQQVRYAPFRNGTSLNLLNSVAMNAAAASRTLTIKLDNAYKAVRIYLFFVDGGGSETSVSATPTVSLDGTNYAGIPSRGANGSGDYTVSDTVDNRTVSGDSSWTVQYDVQGATYLKVVLAGTAASALDSISAQAVGIA